MILNHQSGPLSGRVLETKALYVEPRVKTYGFQRITDLVLFEVSAEAAGIALLGRALVEVGDRGAHFQLVFSRASSRKHEIALLVSRQWERAVLDSLNPLDRNALSFRRTCPAELVFFQGPHFGDRYGILETAFRTLSERGIPMLSLVCSGSTIYLVLPWNKSGEAVAALSLTFEVPRTNPSHDGRQAGT